MHIYTHVTLKKRVQNENYFQWQQYDFFAIVIVIGIIIIVIIFVLDIVLLIVTVLVSTRYFN